MKISNMLDVQLEVKIVGGNGDTDSVLLQPRGGVNLPDGFKAVNPKLKGLYVHADEPVVQPTNTVAATTTSSTKKSAAAEGETTK